MFQKKIIALLPIFLLPFSIFAQIAAKSANLKTDVSPEIREKAFKLLDSLAREAEQFSLPLNRVGARIGVAHLLWDKDEKAARAIFQNAVSELGAMINRVPPDTAESGEEYTTVQRYELLADAANLRKELLIALAARDVQFALDALQTLSVKNADGTSIFEDDDALELELAAKIAAADPQQAYNLAKKNLDHGLGANLFPTLENLYKKDSELGTKLARDILNTIKRKDTIIYSPSGSMANTNSNMSKDAEQNPAAAINTWEIQGFLDSVKKLNKQAANNKKPAVLSDGDIKEAVDILAQIFVKQQYLSAYEISKMMPEITKYFPASALAIRRKIGQSESAALDDLVKNQNFQNEIEDKTADEILRMIEKSPVAGRDDLYYQAAETAFNNGEIEQAKLFHDKIKATREYDYLGKGISGALPLEMANKGDLSEIRQSLAKLKTSEERIEILTTAALAIARNGDLKTASRLMIEARSFYSGAMKNRRNLTSVFQMAKSYSVIEPDQSFSLLESNTRFFNDIIGAAILLDEFNESGATKNDELRLDAVRRVSYQNAPNAVELIKNLAAADFDRSIGLAEQFARPEVRFFARFRVAEALLDPKAEENEKLFQTRLNGETGDSISY